MQYLLDNCFKIDIHIMPDLPGATPQIDRDMFDYVYSIICPDQMKVYPCEVVPWTVIEKWYKSGKYIVEPTRVSLVLMSFIVPVIVY